MMNRMPSDAPVRLPKNYQLVYDIVQASGLGRHLTMAGVLERATQHRPGIGLSTVYRGLVRLRELGLISEIVVPGSDCATYEPLGPPHSHFRCVACGVIEDVSYAVSPRVLRAVREKHGFELTGGTVTFEGRCTRCRLPRSAGASAAL